MSAAVERKASSENKLSYSEKTSDNGVDSYVVDAEAANVDPGATLHRTMKNRHIAMIRYVIVGSAQVSDSKAVS